MTTPLASVSTKQVLQWIGSHLLRYKMRVVGAVIALFTAAVAWLLLGQGIKYAIDSGFIENAADTLNKATVLVLAITIVACLATYARFYLMTWLGERVSADIRNQVYAHLLSLPPSFFAELRTGEVISRFTSDTTIIQTVVGMSLSMTLRSVVTFVGALALMTFSSPLLTFCVIVAVPAVLVPIKVLAPQVRRYAKESQDKVADLGARIDESLHEIMTVQAYTAENAERLHFSKKVELAMDVAKKRIHYRSLLIGCIMCISMTAIIFIAWVGARQVLDGTMTVGELSAFLFYAVMAGGSVATISEVIGEVQRGVGASERLYELFTTEPAIRSLNADTAEASTSSKYPTLKEASAKPIISKAAPKIELENVSFAYPNSKPLFNNLNINIQAGERLALVGASGAGKTTLFQLLMRFYDPSAGQILFNGAPINKMPVDVLRQHIAIVTQEPVVFADTVLENIRYGSPLASDDAVINAAKQAFAHEFIDNLDERYNTQLGERGVKLSGGQKQRIAIARAILADRPILLLDEATSALDAMSERMVQRAIDRLMVGKTSIVIAHRLATVQHADRILVMDKGQVVGSGDHASLMKSDTLYREYAELQLLS
ncbi:ABC transporter ATP-binding protein/permease [Alteromonas macleodii str. 'Black Sea 11']|uniref:ABC transporter transmembrane domain-containing protein n=1 Tax=Alteromonas abrolhosensis TaxID=1892904 RepID=UPI000286EE77|nr:ABC transporter transmembrane domain-containing protein [Alteromonas abrolhosensis]AFT77778.1 ABC transporter ATP-binding protein/permease [Alteromonas macleodii str. 'Black Sea 11']NKW88151.1 ATP-binding cassette domain-containing protein [Alteromonadaceae bacterium A_SAG4]NKX04541.1 ATP-binding cassette domain-containing protein [Alteromonadaceae bacterium A_SAG6]NKX34728.1 ATP-binding cassette domain-containing protein [Alteromonadaceae bacterium A_SAG3]